MSAAALLRREVTLAFRIGGGALIAAVFFVIVTAVVPFAVGPDLNLLARIGPAILWLGALLASLLGLDRLFQADQEDGSLDLLMLAPLALETTVAVKTAAYWLTTSLPLVLVAPVLGVFMNLSPVQAGAVALTLLAGTPALAFIGAVGAALTVTLRRGGLLLSVLVLPLTVPTLIFGVSAATAAATGEGPFRSPMLFACALSLASAVIGPVAAAAALRAAQE